MNYNTDEAYDKLRNALTMGDQDSEKRLFLTAFYWWQLFYFLNQNLSRAESFTAKSEIIDRFVHYYESLFREQGEDPELELLKVAKEVNLQKEDLPSLGEISPLLAPEIQTAIQLFRKEKEAFHKNFRSLLQEREKRKKGLFKTIKKRAEGRRKWLAS